MLKKLLAWHDAHYVQISWFLIGLFVAFGVSDFGHGNYFGAMINFGLAIANFIFQDK